MNNPFFSDLFILILLIFNCGRLFFLKYGKSDCLTVLSPICLVLSIANIIAWNMDIFSAGILIISIFATIINFRALIRFFCGLLVDHYSIAFSISDIITLLVSLAETVVLLIYTPSVTNLYDYDVKETTIRLSGNFTRGFQEAEALEPASGIIKIYESEDNTCSRNQIIMMLPDKRSEFRFYKPYLVLLAQAGYKIYMADFFADDIHWFNSIFDSPIIRRTKMDYDYFENKLRFESEKEFYTYNSMFEYRALMNFIEKKESTENGLKPVFIISDWMAEDAAVDFIKEAPEKIAGLLKLSELECYKSVGFGNVQQEYPYLASKLGLKKDSSRSVPKEMAMRTIDAIQLVAPYYPPAENNTEDGQETDESIDESTDSKEA